MNTQLLESSLTIPPHYSFTSPRFYTPHRYQCFKIAVSVDGNHAESYSNLGVLELRKGNIDHARSNFSAAQRLAPHMFESSFNGESSVCRRRGEEGREEGGGRRVGVRGR